MDDGFLEARPRSGLFVAAGAPQRVAEPAVGLDSDGRQSRPPDWASRVLRSLRG